MPKRERAESVSRQAGGNAVKRAILVGVLVLGVAGVVLWASRGSDPALAARGEASRAATSPAASQPAASQPETTSTAAERPSEAIATPATPAAVPAALPQALASIPDIDPHEALGSKSAPVVVEVFSDFQCPACKALFTGTNRQLMDNYVSTGKVYLIHRDFPLPMHAYSKVAAQYSRASAQIGKLEAVEQVLFQNQEKWEQTGDVDGTVATVLSTAEMGKVRSLVKSGTMDAMIAKDQALGQTYRVNQTPTTVFHANGQVFPYAGVMNWDVLKQFLDQLLNQK
jgi:protein-disulfide isomerase